MKISAATFVLNAFKGGYPILEAMAAVLPYCDEMVVVEAGSGDGTRELLDSLAINEKIRVESYALRKERGPGCYAEAQNFALDLCTHKAIIFFQADEVYHENLIRRVVDDLPNGINKRVWRIQPWQNFQFCKWWPHRIHRIVEKGTARFTHDGAWTDIQDSVPCLGNEWLLWDCSNVFRDSVRYRRWWRGQVGYSDGDVISEADLKKEHWTWRHSPFKLPKLCEGLVGMTQYRPRPKIVQAIREDRCDELIG